MRRKGGNFTLVARAGLGAVLAAGSAPVLAHAQVGPTPACTRIENVASLRYTRGESERRIASNAAIVEVATYRSLALSAPPSPTPVQPGAETAIAFTLNNQGNAASSVRLVVHIDGLSTSVRGIAADRDGDMRFDPERDALLPDASVELGAGKAVTLFVLVRADTVGQAVLTLDATAASGASACDGTGDGAAHATVMLAAGGDVPSVQLVKSQAVSAPDGSSKPVRGATITYTIESRFAGAGIVKSARLIDPVPRGTRYVAGSLTLDDNVLSDAEDGDAGAVATGEVRVALGDVPAPAIRTVRFQVIIE